MGGIFNGSGFNMGIFPILSIWKYVDHHSHQDDDHKYQMVLRNMSSSHQLSIADIFNLFFEDAN